MIQKTELKKGVNLHVIDTNTFKTNLIAVFLTTPLSRENVTFNTLIPAILRRGSKEMQTQEEISKQLEEMYGAAFDCGIDKTGDNHILKFYLESVNDRFLPQKEDLLKESIDKMLEIVFHPYLENGCFKTEYVEGEKENIKQIIEGKIDNKRKYALDRCMEEMYKGKPYGLYRYGYVEDLENINPQNLYEHYQELIQNCKIDLFVSGKLEENVVQIITENERIKQLADREPNYIKESQEKECDKGEVKQVEDKMDVAQGNLVMGLNINEHDPEQKYVALVYNAILGGLATSKLFQNVREKASLAYVARSSYDRQKNSLYIMAGIEIENYQKALEIIKVQLDDMVKGNFTEEELENAKINIIATIKTIPDEQDTEISYYLGQELAGMNVSFQEYEEKIRKVTKQEIIELANKVQLNTIYFLRN